MSIIIKGGTIVNEGKTFVGDVVIEGEQIESVSPSISSTSTSSSTVIDATGCYVLPGVIDDHVHFREPGLMQRPTSRARAGQQRQAA